MLVLGLALVSGAARAEADVFGLGNGQLGSLVVKDSGVTLNASTALAAEVSAGATELRVADASAFSAGQLVLVLQMTGERPLAEYQGSTDVLDLGGSGAGRWELARLAEVSTGVLRLTAPLVRGYAGLSQVVFVPEYTDVRIVSGASLRAPDWNGHSGGVLALLATGTVTNQGTLDVDGTGFRGAVPETAEGLDTIYGCTQEDVAVGSRGGVFKGEGLASALSGAPTHGNARLANGGGGANCHDSGGGGGGHIGKGGKGGRSVSEDGTRDVGGRGGMSLRYVPTERLLLGGGGGGGYPWAEGGTGGGILFVRAHEMLGARGALTANGYPPDPDGSSGGGGGGAGGTVYLRLSGRLFCGAIEAEGGDGAGSGLSPGGGGGGGNLFVQAASVGEGCDLSVLAGAAGRDGSGNTHDAEPLAGDAEGFVGQQTVIAQPFAVPGVPIWVSPSAGQEVLEPMPRLEGKADPGASVQVVLDGVPLGEPVVADDSGAFSLVPPTALAAGSHEVRAWAEQWGVRGGTSEPLGFIVGPLDLRVGAGCDVASGSAWLGLALLVRLLGRRGR